MWMTTEIQLVPKSEMNRATAPVYTFMVHIEKTFLTSQLQFIAH